MEGDRQNRRCSAEHGRKVSGHARANTDGDRRSDETLGHPQAMKRKTKNKTASTLQSVHVEIEIERQKWWETTLLANF